MQVSCAGIGNRDGEYCCFSRRLCHCDACDAFSGQCGLNGGFEISIGCEGRKIDVQFNSCAANIQRETVIRQIAQAVAAFAQIKYVSQTDGQGCAFCVIAGTGNVLWIKVYFIVHVTRIGVAHADRGGVAVFTDIFNYQVCAAVIRPELTYTLQALGINLTGAVMTCACVVEFIAIVA